MQLLEDVSLVVPVAAFQWLEREGLGYEPERQRKISPLERLHAEQAQCRCVGARFRAQNRNA